VDYFSQICPGTYFLSISCLPTNSGWICEVVLFAFEGNRGVSFPLPSSDFFSLVKLAVLSIDRVFFSVFLEVFFPPAPPFFPHLASVCRQRPNSIH